MIGKISQAVGNYEENMMLIWGHTIDIMTFFFFFFKFGNLDPVSFHKGPKKPHLGSRGKKRSEIRVQ